MAYETKEELFATIDQLVAKNEELEKQIKALSTEPEQPEKDKDEPEVPEKDEHEPEETPDEIDAFLGL